MIPFGLLKIYPLPEGRFTVGLDKQFVPYKDGDPLPPGALFMSVTPILVETPNDLILLDTGLGRYAPGRDATFLLENLNSAGFQREDVTRVLLSHLHFDHSGGSILNLAGEDVPTFPRAEYIIQEGELTGEGYAGESEDVRDLVAEVLDKEGQLVTVDGSTQITDEIKVELTKGHTEFHQSIRITVDELTATFGGDVLPSPAQIKRSFRAKYDLDPAVGQTERDRIIRGAADNSELLLMYHSPTDPAVFVSHGQNGYEITAAEG